MEVIFVDNHLLVVAKPAGISTQPHDTHEPDLETRAKQWIKKRFAKPGNVFLVPIHRLDKPVSGLVLFARTSKALARLQALMRERKIVKIYHATVAGKPKLAEADLEHYLVHDEFRARVSTRDDTEAKQALLHYKLLSSDGQTSQLEITLHTGRYHQIRAQLAAIGHPILGDEKYGSTHPYKKDAIALAHVRLELPHPVTKQPLIFDLKNKK